MTNRTDGELVAEAIRELAQAVQQGNANFGKMYQTFVEDNARRTELDEQRLELDRARDERWEQARGEDIARFERNRLEDRGERAAERDRLWGGRR